VIRVVVDPGVLIAALITPGGVPARIIRAWIDGAFELVASPHLLDELMTTLLRPKFRRWVSADDAVLFVETVRLAGILVEDPERIEPLSRDPDDDYLIALARAAGAVVLVSGDADLTTLDLRDPPIVDPRRFLSTLERVT
jgi:putative PIN family toxin of toxin-antitoxin system